MTDRDTQNRDAINEIKVEFAGLKSSMNYVTVSLADLKEYVKTTFGEIAQEIKKNYVTQDQLAITVGKLAFLEKVIYTIIAVVATPLIGYAVKVIFSLK